MHNLHGGGAVILLFVLAFIVIAFSGSKQS